MVDRLCRRVALRVAELRKAAGLTQQEVADRAGLRRGYVARVESKAENLSLSTLNRLAFALGVEPAELLKGIPAEEPELREPDAATGSDAG